MHLFNVRTETFQHEISADTLSIRPALPDHDDPRLIWEQRASHYVSDSAWAQKGRMVIGLMHPNQGYIDTLRRLPGVRYLGFESDAHTRTVRDAMRAHAHDYESRRKCATCNQARADWHTIGRNKVDAENSRQRKQDVIVRASWIATWWGLTLAALFVSRERGGDVAYWQDKLPGLFMAVAFADTFADTNGTLLQSHTPTGGAGGSHSWIKRGTSDADIAANRVSGKGSNGRYCSDGAPTGADYEVNVVRYSNRFGVSVRLTQTGNVNGYHCWTSSSNKMQVWRVDNASYTQLGSTGSTTTSDGDKIGLDGTGSNLTGLLNDVAEVTTSDSTYTAKECGGLRPNGNNFDADNWQLEEVAAVGDPEDGLVRGKLLRGGLLTGGRMVG